MTTETQSEVVVRMTGDALDSLLNGTAMARVVTRLVNEGMSFGYGRADRNQSAPFFHGFAAKDLDGLRIWAFEHILESIAGGKRPLATAVGGIIDKAAYLRYEQRRAEIDAAALATATAWSGTAAAVQAPEV